jgi:hypothetical protein
MNKLINFLITTFRHKNFILIFTSPYTDFIDTATLKLFHANFETSTINRTDNTCTLKPKLLQYNQSMRKWYRKYLKVIIPGSGMVKIKRWCLPKPSEELIKAYENKKKEFTSALNKEIEDKLNTLDGNGKPQKLLTPLQEQIIECLKKGMNKQTQIAEHLGKYQSQIAMNIQYIRNKGYDLGKYAGLLEYHATPMPMPQFELVDLKKNDKKIEEKDQKEPNNNDQLVVNNNEEEKDSYSDVVNKEDEKNHPKD